MDKVKQIFEKQLLHFILLTLLLFGLFELSELPGFWSGEVNGINTRAWFYFALANTVAHQVFVWFCWRTQLHADLLTRWLGKAAFPVYAGVFSVMIILRPVVITFLSISNRNTAPLNAAAATSTAVIMAIPLMYLAYSMKTYFGFKRAFGIDHFDDSCRSKSLVREGIFRFSGNSMYVFGFFALWIPALVFSSAAALSLALFSHLYIWVHYFTVEKPDMVRIYGNLNQAEWG